MKATGIVRRIDELGRVVIPKEIRRTLRIREGDPLELFTDRDELMLKKYSPIASVERFSEGTAKSLHEQSGYLAAIADTDNVLHAFGMGRKALLSHAVSDEVTELMATFSSVLSSRLVDNDSVYLHGFGQFEVKKKLERVTVNPVNGKRYLVPPKLVAIFKPGMTLKSRLKELGENE